MKKLLLSAVLAASFGAVALAPQTAKAVDGTITFGGAVTAKTCTVKLNAGTNGSGTVTLPSVSTSAFSGLGTTAGETQFTIGVSGCATGMNTVATYFEAGPTVNSNGRLVVTTGGATNLDLQLLYSDGSIVTAGSAAATSGAGLANISSTTNSATLTYFVRYYQNSATAPTAGSVASSVNYSMIYN
ncbi:fimbrial protein [Dyella sp. C9]|uniref:fimbrial protein n=1 Tax=Dyella sp. C9 TaxID=2202154 RepID=UPI000DEED335|nr:fimbrial protein [Dyella sp. C9]